MELTHEQLAEKIKEAKELMNEFISKKKELDNTIKSAEETIENMRKNGIDIADIKNATSKIAEIRQSLEKYQTRISTIMQDINDQKTEDNGYKFPTEFDGPINKLSALWRKYDNISSKLEMRSKDSEEQIMLAINEHLKTKSSEFDTLKQLAIEAANEAVAIALRVGTEPLETRESLVKQSDEAIKKADKLRENLEIALQENYVFYTPQNEFLISSHLDIARSRKSLTDTTSNIDRARQALNAARELAHPLALLVEAKDIAEKESARACELGKKKFSELSAGELAEIEACTRAANAAAEFSRSKTLGVDSTTFRSKRTTLTAISEESEALWVLNEEAKEAAEAAEEARQLVLCKLEMQEILGRLQCVEQALFKQQYQSIRLNSEEAYGTLSRSFSTLTKLISTTIDTATDKATLKTEVAQAMSAFLITSGAIQAQTSPLEIFIHSVQSALNDLIDYFLLPTKQFKEMQFEKEMTGKLSAGASSRNEVINRFKMDMEQIVDKIRSPEPAPPATLEDPGNPSPH